MATRATLTFIDERNQFHVYHHYDGYPSYILPLLEETLPLAWPLPRFEAGEFSTAFIATAKKQPGNVYLTEDAKFHADTYFHYTVYKNKRNQLCVRVQYGWHFREGLKKALFTGTLKTALKRDWEDI